MGPGARRQGRIADDLACIVTHQRENEGLKREIPDYALDQHTRQGKAMGRSWQHWAEEGCQLTHEVPKLNPYRERALAMRQQYGRLKPRTQGHTPRKADPQLFDMEEDHDPDTV